MAVALVVDDDPMILHRFKRELEGSDVQLITAQSAKEGLIAVREHQPDVTVLDVMLPDLSGLESYRQIRDVDPQLPVIFITTSSESSTAIEAMSLGAYDYLLKPLDSSKLRALLLRAIEIRRLMQTPVELVEQGQPDSTTGDALIGRCPAMQEVYKSIGRVARQDVTVLIQGESGTGKELVARAIYQHSHRKHAPLLAINCAAIPESLLESELFGHEKGAFTGAERRRIGKFEQCSGGTIFLDEIGDMSPPAQSKMLRVLQQQSFERVGGGETVHTDVRIIAATNVDLEQAVADGEFREDLFFRLNVFTIHLPPLRERVDDLPLLVNHFLHRFSRQLDKPVNEIAPDAMDLLVRYPWPGNIRELESVLKQALLHATGSVLLVDFLPEPVRHSVKPSKAEDASPNAELAAHEAFLRERISAGSENLYAEALERMERQLLMHILQHTGGNQLQAAKILGITRGSLRNKIRSLGITIDRIVGQDVD
jgi:two-component system nitrogen regulation response regulator GlnG